MRKCLRSAMLPAKAYLLRRRRSCICTTFPCHLCAKHIVASGIQRVVYLEPYPKSYAAELHRGSIQVDPAEQTHRVVFEAFMGVSPYRYRDLFEKGKRKYSGGLAEKWTDGTMRPVIAVYYPSYFKAETHVVAQLNDEHAKASHIARQRDDLHSRVAGERAPHRAARYPEPASPSQHVANGRFLMAFHRQQTSAVRTYARE